MQYAWARKSDADHTVEGPVYVPGEIDSDFKSPTLGEVMDADAIKAMAWDWFVNDRALKVDTNHNEVETGCVVVESYCAKEGDPTYKPGTWVVTTRIDNPEIWGAVQKGDINGYSFGGTKNVSIAIARVEGVRSVNGTTEKSDTDGFSEHHHEVALLEFDVAGRVIPTVTARELNHSHAITRTTATNESFGHSHRLVIDGV